MYTEGRARKMRNVHDSLRRDSRRGNQSDVWGNISAKSIRMGAESPTSAQEAMYVKYRRSLDEDVETLKTFEGQVGAVRHPDRCATSAGAPSLQMAHLHVEIPLQRVAECDDVQEKAW